jgi:hypothetical protein
MWNSVIIVVNDELERTGMEAAAGYLQGSTLKYLYCRVMHPVARIIKLQDKTFVRNN